MRDDVIVRPKVFLGHVVVLPFCMRSHLDIVRSVNLRKLK